MSKTNISILITFGLLISFSALAQPNRGAVDSSQSYTLEACLAYAFENNENIKVAELEKAIARADVGITKAQGLPQIDFTTVYTNNFAVPTVYLPAEAGSAFPGNGGNGSTDEEVALRFGIQNQANAQISASQMIFDGSYFVGLAAARTYVELSQKDFQMSKIDIAEMVTKSYYTALVNQARLQLIEGDFNRTDTLLRETKLMYENGFAEKIDVDRLSVQYNNVKTERERVRRNAELSYLTLKFQMGMPIDQDIVLSDRLSDIEFDPEIEAEQNFEYDHRPEFSKVQVNRDLVQLDIKNTRVQRLPKITLTANFGYNTGTDDFSRIINFDRWNELGAWGVNLSLPIFDGLRKFHQVQRSKVQMQQLGLQSNYLKNSIDLEIARARINLENSKEQLANQQENYELAQEVFRVSKIKYQEGVGSNIEVINAENSLLAAETNYFQALYNALIAKVDLKKSLGVLIEE